MSSIPTYMWKKHNEIGRCLLVFIVVDYSTVNYIPLSAITAVNQND